MASKNEEEGCGCLFFLFILPLGILFWVYVIHLIIHGF